MSTYSIKNELVGWQTSILAAAAQAVDSLPTSDFNRLQSAMNAAVASLDALKAAQEKADQLHADTSRSPQYRIDKSDQLRTVAAAAANGALDDLRAVADSTYARLSSAWKPAKPSGVSDPMVLDRKHDLERLLAGSSNDASHVIDKASRMLADALAKGDADSMLTAYVLASGPLDLFYEACGVDPKVLAQTFAARGPSTSTAATLAPLISQTADAGTLRGFIYAAQSEINSTVAAIKAQSDQWAVIFIGQGQLKPGGSQWNAPTSVDPGNSYARRGGTGSGSL